MMDGPKGGGGQLILLYSLFKPKFWFSTKNKERNYELIDMKCMYAVREYAYY